MIVMEENVTLEYFSLSPKVSASPTLCLWSPFSTKHPFVPHDILFLLLGSLFLIMMTEHLHYILLSPLLIVWNTIIPVGLPVHTRQTSLTLSSISPSSTKPSSGLKRHRSVSENDDVNGEDPNGGGGGGSKRRKSFTYHAHRVECLPCVLWQQSGSDIRLQHMHPVKDSRHVGIDAIPLSQYACFDGITFNLTSDDCICKPCYADYKRKANKENQIPRWAKLKQEHYSRGSKHCLFCCGENCSCETIQRWATEEWAGECTPISTWKKYLAIKGMIEPDDQSILNRANHICRQHMRKIYDIKQSRSCAVCTSQHSSSWSLICDAAPTPQHIDRAFNLELGSTDFFSWICRHCSLCYSNDVQLEAELTHNAHSQDPLTSEKSKLFLSTLCTLRSDGVAFTKDILIKYRSILSNLNVPHNQHQRFCRSFSKYIITIIAKHHHLYGVFSPTNASDDMGRAIYDKNKFTTYALEYTFKLKEELWKKCYSIDNLQSLIRKQISLFPPSKHFDYTQQISQDGSLIELDKYFDPELHTIIELATKSKTSSKQGPSSAMYKHLRKIRINMVIAILCLIMNPLSCFVQTLTGLQCYAYGLRDKGFKVLNALGTVCSIDHIRSHGAYWAAKRKAVESLDCMRAWRISIDNLNFKMKFAKNLPESVNGVNKMLNLLTCQVSHSTNHQQADPKAVKPLDELVFQSMRNGSTPPPRQRSSLTLTDFNGSTTDNYHFHHFLAVCYVCTLKRLPFLPTQHSNTFLQAIQELMPSWTPPKRDNIVYATIEEASSSNIGDIEAYLAKVKHDLKISHTGYPSKVPIAGDQQTYALMKKLQSRHPDQYSWMVVLHGDWHMLQLLAEIIRDILWDGAFKQMCSQCGYKKIPTQWQELHLLLLALYQALLHKALLVFTNKHDATMTDHKAFWLWLSEVASDNNNDEISRFWARIIPFLSSYIAYFVAVRSGNWALRNSSLQALAPLFFSYNHYKYEELTTTAISDALTLPADLLSLFLKGEWTVSVKGKPHHNIALDEAHECIINLRLKTITSRPSHFRTVELSNFMSYLDIIVRGFEGYLYAFRTKEPVEYRKRYVCQRAKVIGELLEDTVLFDELSGECNRPLRNMLCLERPLDSRSIEDLLHIESLGRQRMATYVEEHVLATSEKRRKRPQKLATFSSRPSSTREGKKREKELTNIAKNAMELLQSNGITAQTSPYPLAIADIDGNLRMGTKSKFLDTLVKCLDFQQVISSTFSSSVSHLCTIIDMLYFIHMPPPLSITTFLEYFEHLWNLTVGRYAIAKGAEHVYLIFDKPNYLPPPRSMVHMSRSKKNQTDSPDPLIRDEADIPHGKLFSSLLSNSSTFKAKLLEYVTILFKEKSARVTSNYNFSVTIDSPSLPFVIKVSDGEVATRSHNQHGEADYAIWHHCVQEEPCTDFLVVSSDTDTWVYGLGLCGLGHLDGKQVTVQRGIADSFIDVTRASSMISQHPKLQRLSFPALSLVALYVLTGCDYVSSFYRCTKTNFLEVLIQDGAFICPDGHFMKMVDGEFQQINNNVWIRLVTAVYYAKFFKGFFRSKPILHTYNLISTHPDSPEAKRMLSALPSSQFSDGSNLSMWHDFIRRVTYHVPKVSKFHELKLLPSYQVLTLHCQRANYVMKLALSAPWIQSPFLLCFEQFGWHLEDGAVSITWDSDPQEWPESEDSEDNSDSASNMSDSP